jgi:formate hydrogenlyase transcriptional activator
MIEMSADKSAIYEALFELSQSISGHADLESLCRALSGSLKRVVRFDLLGLLLFNSDSQTFQMYGLALSGKSVDENEYRTAPINNYPAGWVWINQQPLFIARLDQETRWPELLDLARAYGLSSLLLVPLTTGNRRLGVLALGFLNPSEASHHEMDFIHRVASEFAVTIDSHLTRRQYLRERDRLQLLFDLTNTLVSKLSPDELFSAISEQLHKVVAFDVIALTLLDQKTGELLLSGFRMDDNLKWEFDRTRGRPDGMPTAEALATGKPVLTNKADFERFTSPTYKKVVDAGFRSLCSIPLKSPNATLGTLELARTSEQQFHEDDVDLLVQVARQIAIAIENSLAYRELAEMKERLANEKLYLEDEIRLDQNFGEMLGESPAFQNVLKNIQIVGPTEATVLILGETGTGKELAARAIHQQSGRNKNGFIKVNCAAIPSSLLESELFGHEKGAFTGALTQRIGRFELAHQGTLFLDEIGEIPIELQSKLLRAIQEQEFERLGGNRTIRVNVRFVAASNRNLKAMVDTGTFRSDLYYRLHVFPLMLPPLQDRHEDIPLLSRYFIQKYAQRMGRKIESIPTAAMDTLISYEWPGNIRELQNVIERSVILSRGRLLELAMPEIDAGACNVNSLSRNGNAEAEREMILQVLKETNGLVSGPKGAANRLGLKRTTLQARMKKLGITRDYQ